MLCRLRIQKRKAMNASNSSSSSGSALMRRRSSIKQRFQSPIQRFIASGHGSYSDELGFRNFTATHLQAWYRKERLRYSYTLERFPVYHIAALQIQYAWKAHCQHKLFKYDSATSSNNMHSRLSPRLRAVLCIQTAWKSYTNRRIYRYYRDLITFQNTGDPAMMLRAINPAEASLLDASMGAHVRFRLGGMVFPPTIYYKIFTRRAVCDLNAFSPKDYTLTRQLAPTNHSNNGQSSSTASRKKANRFFIRVGNSYYRAKQVEQDTRNWYKRIEYNGWRPVTAKVVSEANNDPIALATSKKPVANFHFSKLVRKQDVEKQRRLKKRAWMQKLYLQGLVKETGGVGMKSCEGGHLDDDYDTGSDGVDPETVFDVDFENDHWEEDADDMFQWASALDYDEYVDNWQLLGKTASTDDKVRDPQQDSLVGVLQY